MPIARIRPLAALLALAAFLVVAVSPAAASGTTYYVAPSGSDSVTCGANSQATPFATIQRGLVCATDGDAIDLAPSGATPYPGVGTISHNVTIEAGAGGDARSVAIDVSKPDDISGSMTVAAAASVTMSGVTVDCSDHGCLFENVINNGNLTLEGDVVTGAGHNAAISSAGSGARLTVLDSTIAHNHSDAGGVGNSDAGAIASGVGALLTVANSTIADNSNARTGSTAAGGIFTASTTDGAVTLINDTITANHVEGGAATPGGGGIADTVGSGGTATPIRPTNTIIAGNTATHGGPDCQGRIADGSGGHNLIGDGTNCFGVTDGVNGDQVGVPIPGLIALADNGGPTDTVALQSASPAIGAGDSATCQGPPIAGKDQRGAPRGPSCDVGAAERWSVAIDGAPKRYTNATTASFTFFSSEPAAGYRCRVAAIDAGYTNCASPKTYSGLAEGTYRFRVYARGAGVSSLPAARTWTVDRSAPSVHIDSGPSGTSGPDVSFDFSGADPSGIRTFRCHLDGAPWRNCASPKAYTGLAAGPHRFYLRSVDRAGNRSHRVIRDWTVSGP